MLRYSHNLCRRWHFDCILVVSFWWWVQLVSLDSEERYAAMIGWCSTPVIGEIAPLPFCFNVPSEICWGTPLRLLWRCIRSYKQLVRFVLNQGIHLDGVSVRIHGYACKPHRDIRLFKRVVLLVALWNNQFLLPVPLCSASRFVTARTWQWSPGWRC